MLNSDFGYEKAKKITHLILLEIMKVTNKPKKLRSSSKCSRALLIGKSLYRAFCPIPRQPPGARVHIIEFFLFFVPLAKPFNFSIIIDGFEFYFYNKTIARWTILKENFRLFANKFLIFFLFYPTNRPFVSQSPCTFYSSIGRVLTFCILGFSFFFFLFWTLQLVCNYNAGNLRGFYDAERCGLPALHRCQCVLSIQMSSCFNLLYPLVCAYKYVEKCTDWKYCINRVCACGWRVVKSR